MLQKKKSNFQTSSMDCFKFGTLHPEEQFNFLVNAILVENKNIMDTLKVLDFKTDLSETS